MLGACCRNIGIRIFNFKQWKSLQVVKRKGVYVKGMEDPGSTTSSSRFYYVDDLNYKDVFVFLKVSKSL